MVWHLAFPIPRSRFKIRNSFFQKLKTTNYKQNRFAIPSSTILVGLWTSLGFFSYYGLSSMDYGLPMEIGTCDLFFALLTSCFSSVQPSSYPCALCPKLPKSGITNPEPEIESNPKHRTLNELTMVYRPWSMDFLWKLLLVICFLKSSTTASAALNA
jgi:hypothetical protein